MRLGKFRDINSSFTKQYFHTFTELKSANYG
jgi:hypothetical protein